MASTRLLGRLKFRTFPVPDAFPVASLALRFAEGKPLPPLRKFAREYLPVLLYKFPAVKVSQAYAAPGEKSALTLVDASGASRDIPLAGKTDRALYCEVTGLTEADVAGPPPLIVEHKAYKKKRRAAPASAAPAAPGAKAGVEAKA